MRFKKMKKCITCGEMLRTVSFAESKTTPDKLVDECFSCARKSGKPSGKERRAKNLITGKGTINILNREMLDKIFANCDGYSTLKDACEFVGPKVFASLVDLSLNGEGEDTRLKAGAIVIDRIYGKQAIVIEANVKNELSVILMPALKEANIIELDDNGEPILLAEYSTINKD